MHYKKLLAIMIRVFCPDVWDFFDFAKPLVTLKHTERMSMIFKISCKAEMFY